MSFFKRLATIFGDFVSLDENTEEGMHYVVARMLVMVSDPLVLPRKVKVMIDEQVMSVSVKPDCRMSFPITVTPRLFGRQFVVKKRGK